jgi:hypothetical protein
MICTRHLALGFLLCPSFPNSGLGTHRSKLRFESGRYFEAELPAVRSQAGAWERETKSQELRAKSIRFSSFILPRFRAE